jgi:hypothetical protein
MPKGIGRNDGSCDNCQFSRAVTPKWKKDDRILNRQQGPATVPTIPLAAGRRGAGEHPQRRGPAAARPAGPGRARRPARLGSASGPARLARREAAPP